MTRIFISHSYLDEAIAYKLVNFLLAALSIKEEEIFCSSNPDQGLSYSSSSATDKLKEQLIDSEAMIVLITADSLHSAWIPFEVGTFWTTDKPLIPILGTGLVHDDLPSPLRSLLSISIDDNYWSDKVNNAINQLAERLEIKSKLTKRRNDTLQEFFVALESWKTQRTANLDLQQEIDQLQKQIGQLEQELLEALSQLAEQKQSAIAIQQEKEKLKRSHKEELEQLEKSLAFSQEEKEELDRNYQEQKQELEQKLARRIKQLEKEQEHINDWENKERSLQATIEQKDNEIMRLRERLIEQSQNKFVQQDLKSFSFAVLTVNERGEEVKREQRQARYFTEKLGNGVTLDMISIPGGKFIMGTEEEEIERLVKKFSWDRYRREKPQHEVTLQPFWMGRYPVTQAQWKAVASLPKVNQDLEATPSKFKGDNRPVERVSWEDAVEFCQRISQKTGKEYRLPSEAEWEYACRAGTNTPFYFGQTMTDKLANYDASRIYASEPQGEYRQETTGVGIFTPNSFGLFDLHGQVWEWCEDDWHDDYGGAPIDGKAWLSGNSSIKVSRGGSWFYDPDFCRSAYRFSGARGDRCDLIGFRVVCVALKTT